MAKDFEIIKPITHIHPDGDIYVYSPKDKKYHYVGLLVDDLKQHIIMDGEIVTGPAISPAYIKAKKFTKK